MGAIVEELTNENFYDTIKEGLCVVDFWAPWCGPCIAFSPIFEEVSKEFPAAKFYKINVEDYPDIASDQGVMSIPAIAGFFNGQIVESWIGLMRKEEFRNRVKEFVEETR